AVRADPSAAKGASPQGRAPAVRSSRAVTRETAAVTMTRRKSEYDTLTGRGPPDVHGQLCRSVRRSAFGGGDRRIHLRGCSSRRVSAEEQWLDRCDRTGYRTRDPSARTGHLSSAHRPADSSLV